VSETLRIRNKELIEERKRKRVQPNEMGVVKRTRLEVFEKVAEDSNSVGDSGLVGRE
jgi:hypothetical protein